VSSYLSLYCRSTNVAHLLAARADHLIAVITLVELSEASRESDDDSRSIYIVLDMCREQGGRCGR
jgi:hypothetical protein